MVATIDLLAARKTLDQICEVDDQIISVYSLEQHVWDKSDPDARPTRKAELQTIREFEIEPVRPLLTDIFRHLAMPHRPSSRETTTGQGWWIEAEFGSGKSHLLCCLSALALGDPRAWEIVRSKEEKTGRGKRDVLSYFWEGLQGKSSHGKRGILVVTKTLVGHSGGNVGVGSGGRRLVEYILEAVGEQIFAETGQNVSLYPAEVLLDRFQGAERTRYEKEFGKFLHDPRFFDDSEFQTIDDFDARASDAKPGLRRDLGNRLWRFYTEYLKVTPQVPQENEPVLKQMAEAVLEAGYAGLLLVLDEVSLFMKDRDDRQRSDDEAALVVLSNRLPRAYNLPVWTVCAAQQALESQMGAKNILAPDRLKEEHLLQDPAGYYQIVLSRVRRIVDPSAIDNYFLHYRRGFAGIDAAGELEFRQFFPFHKPALEVLRHITHRLTTARSAIHFMHGTLKYQIRNKGSELIRLWELFDRAVEYEEDPGGSHPMLTISAKERDQYRAYESCRSQIEAAARGALKVHRHRALSTLQTLFLYHMAKSRQTGLTPEEVANTVLLERGPDSTPQENVEHYEYLLELLQQELAQIDVARDSEGLARYRFDPTLLATVNPAREFETAQAKAHDDELIRDEAWRHLLALDRWPTTVQGMTLDLSHGVQSLFAGLAPPPDSSVSTPDQPMELLWKRRVVDGRIAMRDLTQFGPAAVPLPPVNTAETGADFAVYIGSRPVDAAVVRGILERCVDPRVLIWAPAPLTAAEADRLRDFAAYRTLVKAHAGKQSDDDVAVLRWVYDRLQTEMGSIARIVPESYQRGRIDSIHHTALPFQVAGKPAAILAGPVERVLESTYESRIIEFQSYDFKKEDAVKVINGLVRSGEIPTGAKQDQNVSAALNFGPGLKISKPGAPRKLDTADNPFVEAIEEFLEVKLPAQGGSLKLDTLYKNFMGWGSPRSYGLSRRMVQIYLLCLVRAGKVRVLPGARSGLDLDALDYSNMADVDFSVRILDSLDSVQRVEKPQNWEVLRPYAEKLLQESIPSTHDDSEIAACRLRIRETLAQEKSAAAQLREETASLFHALDRPVPHEDDLRKLSELFSVDLTQGNDIDRLLFELKKVLGYAAYETGQPDRHDIDDLANRMAGYRKLQEFTRRAGRLRVAREYISHPLPEAGILRPVREIQQKLAHCLEDLDPYIESPVKLQSELLGSQPPVPGDASSLNALIHAYAPLYTTMHDRVTNSLQETRREICDLADSEELRALVILEGITALQPPITPELDRQIEEASARSFRCKNPARSDVEARLRDHPLHECGFGFHNADLYLQQAQEAIDGLKAALQLAVQGKMEVFLTPAVKERLEQGREEPLIAGLLACKTAEEVTSYLVPRALADAGVVETINRYLRKIVVREVRLNDFSPAQTLVDRDRVADLALEFQQFLEAALDSAEEEPGVSIMLRLVEGRGKMENAR